MSYPMKRLKKTKLVAVTNYAANQRFQSHVINQRLGVMILAFVEMDVNLKNVVEKIRKSYF